MHSNDFEHAFSDFIDRREYDEAENALFAIVRIAFEAGWRAAGGAPPQPHRIFELLSPQSAPSDVEKTGEPPLPRSNDQEKIP